MQDAVYRGSEIISVDSATAFGPVPLSTGCRELPHMHSIARIMARGVGYASEFDVIQWAAMTEKVWIFGYGSLIWRPDFPHLDARRAYIDGWMRRFWQGSHDHRGIDTDPGRVVTLVEAAGERCYGRAYLVESDVIEHLDEREKNGYERLSVDIVFDDSHTPGVAYIGSTSNFAFLGEASLDEIAAQIRRCAGKSGSNVEYLLELARALRRLEVSDPHVFELERLVGK